MSDVASAFLSIGIIAVESFILLVSWTGVLQVKTNKRWTYIIVYTALTVTSLFTNLLNLNQYISLTIYVLLAFVILRAFYSNKWYVLLFCGVLGIVYLKTVDAGVTFLAATFTGVPPQTIFANVYSFLFLSTFSKLIEFIGAWGFARVSRRLWKKESPHWQSWLQVIPLPLATCFLLSIAMQLSFTMPSVAPVLFLLNCVFFCLCVLQFSIVQRLDAHSIVQHHNSSNCWSKKKC